MKLSLSAVLDLAQASRDVRRIFGDVFPDTLIYDLPKTASYALHHACEAHYSAITPINSTNIFGELKTADQWADDCNRANEASLEIRRIMQVLLQDVSPWGSAADAS